MKIPTSSFCTPSSSPTITIVLGALLTSLGCGALGDQAIAIPEKASDLSSQSSNQLGDERILAQVRIDSGNSGNSRTGFVAEVVRKVGPAVVMIDTERLIAGNNGNNLSADPYFQHFFGQRPQQNPPRPAVRQRGKGSGFIFDSAGLIFTNAHVVNGANRIVVTLKDGRRFEGKLLGVDKAGDLAIVKITPQGSPLPVATLGDSSQVQVGEWAIAVGNPLGLNNTVTLGIVSSLNRSSDQAGVPDLDLNFIQTDVALNPGNSGGPLLNEQGEVIGINTAILSDARGISFAIPINDAKAKQTFLSRGQSVKYPFIGIEMATFLPNPVSNNNQNQPVNLAGVKVLRVFANQPGAMAGLRSGDTIVEVDRQRVTTSNQLQSIIRNSGIGQVRSFKIERNGSLYTVNVRIGEWSNN